MDAFLARIGKSEKVLSHRGSAHGRASITVENQRALLDADTPDPVLSRVNAEILSRDIDWMQPSLARGNPPIEGVPAPPLVRFVATQSKQVARKYVRWTSRQRRLQKIYRQPELQPSQGAVQQGDFAKNARDA